MDIHLETLAFPAIIEKLKEHAVSEPARQQLDSLTPYLKEAVCRQKMAETTAARLVLDACGSPPLAAMKDLTETLTLCQIGAMLTPAQLSGVALFAVSVRRLASYLRRTESQNPQMAALGRSMENLDAMQNEIERCVSEDRVLDEASPQLRSLRRKMEQAEARIKEKLNQVLQSRKQYLADSFITTRNGRYVLPVLKRFQAQFGGTVVDASASGGTVFMEPTAIGTLQAERAALAVEEDAETRRVLFTLAAMVHEHSDPIRRNMETMTVVDVMFAKAKLSAAMQARAVEVNCARRLCIRQGRHPLLDPATCVPLDFSMDEHTTGVVITGPNTGGKTVAVKTVGLLTLMAQCGLHIPCGEGSCIAMQDQVWCDIGDSQNISQNLSTFSGHMTNIIRILERASRDSLVLLDELGSGTDPAEGMGIAIAVLEELRQRRCMFLVTTHYAQVKAYAANTDHVQTARMAFDPESLAPLYRLEMGKAGESCALHIARRLGLAPHLLARASREVYGGTAEGEAKAMPAPKSGLSRIEPDKAVNDPSSKFAMGDSVSLLPGQENGIVYRPADEHGDVVVQIKGEKRVVRHNRLRLLVPAAELYPPDYDYSIIFDSVANRKASRILGKRYDPTVEIVREHGELY
jgi:dsDNA-specific endonuclease/ATPase MutS2